METYKIEIQEFLSRVIEVKANTLNEAIEDVSEKYKKADIVLDYNDFVEVNFIDINSQSISDEKNNLVKELIDYLFDNEKKHFEEFDVEPENHIFLKIKRLKDIIND